MSVSLCHWLRLENVCYSYVYAVEEDEVPCSGHSDLESSDVVVAVVLENASAPAAEAEVDVHVRTDHDRVAGRQSEAEGLAVNEVLGPDARLGEVLELGLCADPPARVHVPWPVLCACVTGDLIINQYHIRFGRELPWIIFHTRKYCKMLGHADSTFEVHCAEVCPCDCIRTYRYLLSICCTRRTYEQQTRHDDYLEYVISLFHA